jgi:hypothetical protein
MKVSLEETLEVMNFSPSKETFKPVQEDSSRLEMDSDHSFSKCGLQTSMSIT